MEPFEIYLSIATLVHIGISLKQSNNYGATVLTIRNLLCTWNHYYENPMYYNYLYCLGALALNDLLGFFAETKQAGSPWSQNVIQYFMLGNQFTSYFPIITLQLSPYIPKDLYPELFNTNMFMLLTTDYDFAPLCYCACWYLEHMTKKENKYFCWMIVYSAHSLITQAIRDIRNVPEDFRWYPWYYMSSYFLYQAIDRCTGMTMIK